MAKIEVIVPMYNEQGLCKEVGSRIWQAMKETGEPFLIHFMVGGADETYQNLYDEFLHVSFEGVQLHYDGERGLGTAIIKGLFQIGGDAEYVVTMDGDGQCVPEEFKKLWAARGHVLTAAYQDEASDSRGRIRRFESFCATRILKLRYGIQIRSLTLNYRIYQADAVRKIRASLRSRDFAIQPEIVIALCKAGYRYFGSVPVSWPPRASGSSKAQISALEYLRLLL